MIYKKGFTLIELLVVISIIGLLSSVVMSSLNTARQKARIARRVSDLKQVQVALEMYYNTNGRYPITPSGWQGACSGWTQTTADGTIPGLAPTFIPTVPVDPYMNVLANQNCYLYASDGVNYKFMDYNVTDMNLSDVNKLGALKDQCRNDIHSCGWLETNIAISVSAGAASQW